MLPGEKIMVDGEEFTAFATDESLNSACAGCAAQRKRPDPRTRLCENLKAHCGLSDGVVFARSEEELTAARVAWKLAHA